MKKFTLLQKLRNKIRIKGTTSIEISNDVKIVGCNISMKGENNILIIKSGVDLRNTKIEILGDNCVISIGENSTIGGGCYISAKEGKKVLIGKECMFSRNIKLMTSDGHPIFQNGTLINSGDDICINSSVWLADNVTILKGVTVGSNSVAGINATVTKNINEASIAVGNPARVIKNNISWKR